MLASKTMRCRALRWLTSVLAVTATLGGCAYAPGMTIGKDLGQAPKRTTLLTVFNQPDEADLPPPGALKRITPELVRQLRQSSAEDAGPSLEALMGTPKPYTIGPSDVLNIVVWDHPELAILPAGATTTTGGEASGQSTLGNGYNVSPDGLIQFPYVGTLKLAGLTEYGARDLITQRLAKYIKDPQVTVRIQSYRSGRIYVDGEVRTPGLQALTDVPLTLPEALGRAGGLTPNADRSSIAITRNGQTTVVSLPRLTQRGVNPASILLNPGDLVQVLSREDARVYVLGEVSRPSSQFLRNGRLSLNEALGEAGGVNPGSGDPKQIYVVRANPGDQAAIFHLDASTPVAYALAEGFPLQARDVVYVDPVPLVRWNRVISLILPSAQAVTSTRQAVGN